MSRRSNTIKWLTFDELKRLLSVIDKKRDKALFLLAYRHGLRASEVGLLRTDDIDFQKLRIVFHRLKGSYDGEHPLQPDETKALKAHLRSRPKESPILFASRLGDPISRAQLHKLMNQYGELAGIPKEKRHFHVLKHSIVTHLLDAGADLRFIQDWVGHSNIQNTQIYAHLVSSSREEKARKIFLKLPRF
jgi:type 1 fimbriae regulatory protein FimB